MAVWYIEGEAVGSALDEVRTALRTTELRLTVPPLAEARNAWTANDEAVDRSMRSRHI